MVGRGSFFFFFLPLLPFVGAPALVLVFGCRAEVGVGVGGLQGQLMTAAFLPEIHPTDAPASHHKGR